MHKYRCLCRCNLTPVAHINPGELQGDRESAGSHYFQVPAVRSHCSPNRTPAETRRERERCGSRRRTTRHLELQELPLHSPLLPETSSARRRCWRPLCSGGSWTLCGGWAGSLWSQNQPGHSCCNPTRTPGRRGVKKVKRPVKPSDYYMYSSQASYYRGKLLVGRVNAMLIAVVHNNVFYIFQMEFQQELYWMSPMTSRGQRGVL